MSREVSETDRCKSVGGVHVPGCWPCVLYGHHACDCSPLGSTDSRIARLERKVKRLEELAGSRS